VTEGNAPGVKILTARGTSDSRSAQRRAIRTCIHASSVVIISEVDQIIIVSQSAALKKLLKLIKDRRAFIHIHIHVLA